MHFSRWWILVALTACTTTRTLASFDALKTGGHTDGFAIASTTDLRARVDPNSTLYLQSKDGSWSPPVKARDAYVDANGLWITRHVEIQEAVFDRVYLEGVNPILATLLEATRPPLGRIVHEPGTDTYELAGRPAELRPWLQDLKVRIVASDSAPLHAPLRSISGWSGQGVAQYLVDTPLDQSIDLEVATKYGWKWADVNAVDVKNYSSKKSFAAYVGMHALAIPFAFLALAGGSLGFASGSKHSSWSSPTQSSAHPALDAAVTVLDAATQESSADPGGGFQATRATGPVASASRLFTTAARVHSIIRGTLALDGGAAYAKDQVSTGLIARVRFAETFELGGGAREVFTRDKNAWRASTTPVLGLNWYMPLDANFRFAIPIGFEGSWGGSVVCDLRFPVGLRYTTKSGHYFGTLYPATPQYMRVDTQQSGRWSFATSLEFGRSF